MQRVMTVLKVGLILLFCALVGLFAGDPQSISLMPQVGDEKLLFSGAFAISLIYINYAYTGWNAATYIAGEIDDPQRNLPLVLIGGTLIVMALYLL